MNLIARRSKGLISAVFSIVGLVSAAVFPAPSFHAAAAGPIDADARNYATRSGLGEARGPKSLSFESNQGQADSNVKFISRAEGVTVLLTEDGVVMQLGKPGGPGLELNPKKSGSFLRMTLTGGNSSAPMEGIDQIAGRSNYLIGNDPKKWRTNLSNYSRVRQPNVYPGIDVIYYGNQDHLEYDFILSPEADCARINLEFEGAERITIDAKGDLEIAIPGGQIRQRKPLIYQEENGMRKEIAGRYEIKGRHRIGFSVSGYDKSKALVIDPEIIYSTYLGGSKHISGFEKEDAIWAMTVDAAGNAYVTGATNSIDFPETPNALPPFEGQSRGIGSDAFVSKFDPNGGLLYSTYLGGKGWDEAYGIAADSAGNIYVTGQTTSPNFPTTSGAFRTQCGCDASGHGHPDGFVVKLNSAGSLVYSTFLGVETYGVGDMAVDATGNAYVTGTCGLGLPIVNGFLQIGDPGGVFLLKLNSTASAILYSTYVVSGASFGRGIAIDSAGNAFLTGETYSLNLPLRNAAWSTKRGGEFGPSPDMFVAKIDTTKSAADSLIYSTYLPASGGFDIALGASGCVYVSGDASPKDFPRKTILKELKWNEEDDKLRFPYDLLALGFVAKLDPAKSGESSLVYCTFYSRSAFNGRSIGLDSEESVYLAGSSSSPHRSPLPIANASFGGGVFIRSSDDGQTFETLDHGLPNVQLTHLAIDPKNPSIIYAGPGNGLFKSTDGGFNWVSIDKDIRVPVYLTNVLAIDPQTPSTLYAGVDTGPIDPDEQVLADVFKSSDGGESWKATGLVNRGLNVRALAIDPVNTAVIYAGGTSGWTPGSLGQKVAGVFKSTDRGDTWNVMNNGLTSIDVNVLAIDPKGTRTIYAGTKSGLFKSTNGGNSWNVAGLPDYILALAVDPQTPSTVYASVEATFDPNSNDGRGNPRRRIQSNSVGSKLEGPVKTTDGGQSWREINTGFDPFLPITYDIKISPQDSSMLYLGTDAGMYTSNNAGQSWSFSSRMSNSVRALAVHPRTKSVFYAATVTNDKAYLTKLSADGAKLMYASYLGGNTNDSAFCVALDPAGNLYVAGTTTSWNFPTANAFQSELHGYMSSFITKIAGLNNLPEPKEPAPIPDDRRGPRIIDVSVSGKKLRVRGDDFSQGAVIILNGNEQQTSNDSETPSTMLISKKAGKKIRLSQEVTIQVKNVDGTLSEAFRFVRQQ